MQTLAWIILLLGIVGGVLVLGQEQICDDNECTSSCDCNACQTQNCCNTCAFRCTQRCACHTEKCPKCKCTESEKVIEEEKTIEKSDTKTAVNNTVVVHVQTIINNKNEIHKPIHVNSTNINNINFVYPRTIDRNETHRGNCSTPAPVPVDRLVPVYINRPVPIHVPYPMVQKVSVPQPVPVPIHVYQPVAVPRPYPVIQHVLVPQPTCTNPFVCPYVQTSSCRPCYYCTGVYNPQPCLYSSNCSLYCRQHIFSAFNHLHAGRK